MEARPVEVSDDLRNELVGLRVMEAPKNWRKHDLKRLAENKGWKKQIHYIDLINYVCFHPRFLKHVDVKELVTHVLSQTQYLDVYEDQDEFLAKLVKSCIYHDLGIGEIMPFFSKQPTLRMPLPKKVQEYAVQGVRFQNYKLPYQVYLREKLAVTEEVLFEALAKENLIVEREMSESVLNNVYVRWLSE